MGLLEPEAFDEWRMDGGPSSLGWWRDYNQEQRSMEAKDVHRQQIVQFIWKLFLQLHLCLNSIIPITDIQ